MCLVFAGVLLVLSVNFYLSGFYIQAVLTAFFALAAIIFMIKNISNCDSGCNLQRKEDKDDN